MGKRAAILMPTSPAFFTALAASDGRGAVLVNPLAARAEIAFQCTDANVGAIFTVSSFVPRVPAGVPLVLLDDAPRSARVLIDGTSSDVDLGSHHGLSIEGEADVEGRDEEAAIVYTSAMRGRPLGAILTHRNLLANARSTNEALSNTKDDHVLAILPYAHLFGLTVTGVAPLMLGARVTTVDRFNPLKVAEMIANDVTEVFGVPAMWHALLTVIERRGIDLRSSTALRTCVSGGAPLPDDLQARFADVTGHELREGYGLTEGGPVALCNRPTNPNVRGTMGQALPQMEVAILTHEGEQRQLPDGTPGEICIRGENVFRGYVGGREGLRIRDGWLHSGDKGVRHPDGSVEFLGVYKPMFTRNGFNVYPAEIERSLTLMPGVSRAEVWGIPEPTKEFDIAVRVFGNVSEEAVREWCDGQLSAYKQPTFIEIVSRVEI